MPYDHSGILPDRQPAKDWFDAQEHVVRALPEEIASGFLSSRRAAVVAVLASGSADLG